MFVTVLVRGKEIVQRTFIPFYWKISGICRGCYKRPLGCGYIAFRHDGNVMPLTGLLHLEGCYAEETNPEDFYRYE